MAYLGRGLDKISNIEVLDNITFDGSSSYSITKGSVAFTPNSAQSLLISIDGVVQATNFTVSSSTIDFGVAIPSTSVCNFFLHYGTGVMTVPSDGSVTTAKLGNSAVDLTSKVTGALPVANGGTNLSSGFANGITMADQWRLSANLSQSSSTTADITANWERVDTDAYGKIGTGMSESSGIFSFPSTGLYSIDFRANFFTTGGASDFNGTKILVTTDNSSYGAASEDYDDAESQYAQGNTATNIFVNVTDISNVKVKFQFRTGPSNATLEGNSGANRTYVGFVRLGDSV